MRAAAPRACCGWSADVLAADTRDVLAADTTVVLAADTTAGLAADKSVASAPPADFPQQKATPLKKVQILSMFDTFRLNFDGFWFI